MGTRRFLVAGSLALACLVLSSSARADIVFSPNGGTETRLINEINLCRSRLDVAVYTISSSAVARAIVAARRRGVFVRVISDYGQSTSSSSQVRYLRSNGLNVHLLGSSTPYSIMHHKYAVFDRVRMETGSYNWTVSANTSNHENADFHGETARIATYQSNFDRLWSLPHR